MIQNKKQFVMPMDQVTDVAIRRDKKIRNYHVSGITGFFLFGGLLASRIEGSLNQNGIWGRKYLVITYSNEGGTAELCFGCAKAPKAKRFVRLYSSLLKANTVKQEQ